MNDWLIDWMNEWTNEWMKVWVNEWVNEWRMKEWVKEWMNERTNEWMDEYMNEERKEGKKGKEGMDGWMHECMNAWMHEKMNEWMSEWVNEWLKESMNRWTNVSTSQWINVWTEWSLFRMLPIRYQSTWRLCLPAFQWLQRRCGLFSLKWALEPTVRWRMVPWNIAGFMYAVSPYSPHLHPACLVWIDFTKHEGWELMNFVDVVVVHLPELAKMLFILPGRSMSVTGSESP